ncbi:MAG: hypothetical protein ACK5MQ_02305, partial [Pikeienuella sp.]
RGGRASARIEGRRMTVGRAVGLHESVREHDLLTNLGCHALSCDKRLQRLTLRFIALIAARYSWIRDEFTIGHREIARP